MQTMVLAAHLIRERDRRPRAGLIQQLPAVLPAAETRDLVRVGAAIGGVGLYAALLALVFL